MQQVVPGLNRTVRVGQVRADDRQVEQRGLQFGKFDGHTQRDTVLVCLVHHRVHREVLHGVVDVVRTAPAARDEIGHDLHRHRLHSAADELVEQLHLVRHGPAGIGQRALQTRIMVERAGDAEQFVADLPGVVTGCAQFRGKRITRFAIGHS